MGFVDGSLWTQRYFTKIGDNYFPLPVQWEVKNHKWSQYFVRPGTDWWAEFYPPDNMKRPTGPTCDGCHKVGSTGSQCVACHMPEIESEGPPNTLVHAHTFRFISPEMTDEYKIPNPCTSCHDGKSTAWAENAIRQWPERSVWRLGFE